MESFVPWTEVSKLLSLHPEYEKTFSEALDSLFLKNGPLKIPARHYISLMAACRHGCAYLIDLFKSEFVSVGGEPSWLSGGLRSAPLDFQALDVLNRLLAHQPWSLKPEHIRDLLKAEQQEARWGLTQLIHSMVLLTQVHALCSFVNGCGITGDPNEPPNISATNGLSQTTETPQHGEKQLLCSSEESSECSEILQRIKQLDEHTNGLSSSQEEKLQQFLEANTENNVPSRPPLQKKASTSGTGVDTYTVDPGFCYIDFVKRGEDSNASTLKTHECTWEDQGFGVLSQYCQQFAQVVDDKFRVIKSLTYNMLGGHQGVDTKRYRVAIWNYIQSLYGIRHDDYDYREINLMLSIQMKTFVKTVCCFPERITKELRESIMQDFTHSEKIHVLMIISEARMQAELLYALRALNTCINKNFD